MFGFIEAASRGSLPRPQHHVHYVFEQPSTGLPSAHIAHWVRGRGVGGFVYIWVFVWLFLVVLIGRRLRARHREP